MEGVEGGVTISKYDNIQLHCMSPDLFQSVDIYLVGLCKCLWKQRLREEQEQEENSSLMFAVHAVILLGGGGNGGSPVKRKEERTRR